MTAERTDVASHGCGAEVYLRAFSHQLKHSVKLPSFWEMRARLVRQLALALLAAVACRCNEISKEHLRVVPGRSAVRKPPFGHTRYFQTIAVQSKPVAKIRQRT